MLKYVKFSLVCLLLIFIVACSDQTNTKSDVIFTTLSGKQIPMSTLQGKWIIINYWASWCKPCYKEIPELNNFAKKFKSQVMVFGVSYDQVDVKQLPNIAAKMNIKFPTLKYDPAAELGIENVPGLPATYIINPQGKLVKRLLGMQTEATLAKFMKLKSSAIV